MLMGGLRVFGSVWRKFRFFKLCEQRLLMYSKIMNYTSETSSKFDIIIGNI